MVHAGAAVACVAALGKVHRDHLLLAAAQLRHERIQRARRIQPARVDHHARTQRVRVRRMRRVVRARLHHPPVGVGVDAHRRRAVHDLRVGRRAVGQRVQLGLELRHELVRADDARARRVQRARNLGRQIGLERARLVAGEQRGGRRERAEALAVRVQPLEVRGVRARAADDQLPHLLDADRLVLRARIEHLAPAQAKLRLARVRRVVQARVDHLAVARAASAAHAGTHLVSCPACAWRSITYVVFSGQRRASALATARPTTPAPITRWSTCTSHARNAVRPWAFSWAYSGRTAIGGEATCHVALRRASPCRGGSAG